MTPYEVFFFSSGGVEEKWTAKDIGLMRANVLIGFPLGGLLSLAITGSASLVLGPEGITVDTLGRVIDVQVRERRRVDGLVVGRGGPGSLLGYDRRRDQGPCWSVRSCGGGTATPGTSAAATSSASTGATGWR